MYSYLYYHHIMLLFDQNCVLISSCIQVTCFRVKPKYKQCYQLKLDYSSNIILTPTSSYRRRVQDTDHILILFPRFGNVITEPGILILSGENQSTPNDCETRRAISLSLSLVYVCGVISYIVKS